MRVLIASSHPYIPQIAGGAQSGSHELALQLRAQGHAVAVLCGLVGSGRIGVRGRLILKVNRRKTAIDRGLGYPVYRAWFPWEAAEETCRDFRPDVIALQSGHPVRMAEAFGGSGAALVPCFHNVEFDTDLGGDPRIFKDRPCISNSQFTANAFKQAFDIDSVVIHPPIRPERYRTQTDRSSVVFVNPVPEKGVALALEMARLLPRIPFLFVEAWTLDRKARAELAALLAPLRNATFVSRRSDMRAVYRRARLMLVPSQYDETFGRIASEAQLSGIPILASRRGGLPEAVGPGGMLLNSDEPAEAWAAALEALWTDKPRYEELARAALAYSARPELDISIQLDRYVQLLQLAAMSKPPTKAKASDLVV